MGRKEAGAAQKMVEAITKIYEEDADPRSMFQILLAVAASYADTAGVCEGHFLDFARAMYRKSSQPPVVMCPTCGQQNRIRRNDPLHAVCGACKTSLFPALLDLDRPGSTTRN